jgi:hypothetical protein
MMGDLIRKQINEDEHDLQQAIDRLKEAESAGDDDTRRLFRDIVGFLRKRLERAKRKCAEDKEAA